MGTPSVRLPNNFIHQISADMLLNNNFQKRPEIFQAAGSSIQDSMKKMVFPQSSEEFESENNNEVIISIADNIDDPVVQIENDDAGDYYDEDYYDVQDSIQALLFTNLGLGEEKDVAADSIQSTIEMVKENISKEQVANPDLRLKLKRKKRRRRRKKQQEQQPSSSSSHTSLQSNFGDKIFG